MASFRMVMVAGETVRTERSSNKMRRAQELRLGDGQDMLLEGCGQQPEIVGQRMCSHVPD